MKKKTSILAVAGLTLLLMVCLQPRAYAYLDPGSGGFFIQMLLAALLGVSFAIKNFWRRIKEFFVKLFSGGKKPDKKP